MGQGLQYSDLHLLKSNMLFQIIQKKEILRQVKKTVSLARREILATMLLREEIVNPLPVSYFNLLNKKVGKGVMLKRLGFGRKEDYNNIKSKHNFRNNYNFRYNTEESEYQRLIIIDRKKLFFGKNNVFFKSEYKPLIKVFLNYFLDYFKKARM